MSNREGERGKEEKEFHGRLSFAHGILVLQGCG